MKVPYSSSAIGVTASLFFIAILVVGGLLIWAQSDWDDQTKLLYGAYFLAVYFFTTTIYLLTHRVSPEEEAEQQLVEKQQLFSELYQNSPVPYVRTDRSGRILHANSSAVRLLLRNSAEELFGLDLFSSLTGTKETASHISRILQLAANGTFVSDQDVLLKRHDGSERWVMVSAFPYAGKTEILVTLVDITKQKNVETAKTEFVSLASHQLRTPIAALLWNLELLASPKMGELSEKQLGFVVKLKRSADRMSTLIKDFLDASQLEMGTFATKVVDIPLSIFIDEQLEEFEAKIIQKKLVIDKRLPEVEITIQSDEHLLRMVLTNLLSNAVKYTSESGTILVGYVPSAQAVAITVRDTGLGIPAAEQDKMFSKFYRATNVRAGSIAGTGIGLYIVRQAVEKMGGSITFTSQEGEGTEFIVTVPLHR